jgi:hypothetical protein
MKETPLSNSVSAQSQLIRLYEDQIADLTMMSKIELGDDVIAEIQRLKLLIDWKYDEKI